MRKFAVLSLVFALSLVLQSTTWAQTTGTWTPLAHPNPLGFGRLTILLSDGTVLLSGSGLYGTSASWAKLTPDSNGDYINGTWSGIAPMSTGRNAFPSALLPNGNLFVLGGEYSSTTGWINTGEIYDPLTNKWTSILNYPEQLYGDVPIELLRNGKILAGSLITSNCYIYDVSKNTWTRTGNKLRNDQSDEETWTLLPDGSILSYDVFASPAKGAGSSQRYIESSGKWVNVSGPVPVPLSGPALGYELGPSSLLPDGRVFLLGANNNTAFYNPSSDSWTAGPTLPANMGVDDGPGAMLPNGHVLFIADTSSPLFSPPARIFDFDPTTNTITDVTPTSGSLAQDLAFEIAQAYCMLVLPNGHILLTSSAGGIWDYAPSGSPQASWAPTVTSITKFSGTTYDITGTQLNGISEGSSFGDDSENATNYPIVRLKSSSGAVKYCRTMNWSPGLVAQGTKISKAQFTLPAGTPDGNYQLTVIANGIPSKAQSFSIGTITISSNVTATYKGGTLTLTGDANANSLTVSMQAGVLKVEGANGTTINKTAFFSAPISGDLIVNASLGAGDDAISLVGVESSTTSIDLGAGNDKAAIILSNFSTLTIDGGTGTDIVTVTSSTYGTFNQPNVP